MQNRFMENRIVVPKRYDDNYKSYVRVRNATSNLVNIIDSLDKNGKYSFGESVSDKFESYFILIDELYAPLIDTTFQNTYSNDILIETDTLTQKSNLENYLYLLEKKIKNCSVRHDLKFAKLYLKLIESEVNKFLFTKAESGTNFVNFIKPSIVEKDNSVICYFTSIDTLNYPVILIGKFEQHDTNFGIFYKAINVLDTIKVDNVFTELKLDQIENKEAIIQYFTNEGYVLQFKIK